MYHLRLSLPPQAIAFSRLVYHWSTLFLPYQSLSQFRTYANLASDIIFYHNVTSSRKLYLLYTVCTLLVLQNVYLWAFRPPFMERLRQGDVICLILSIDTCYLALVTLICMLIYFIHAIFFTMKPAFHRLFEDILFRDTHRTLTGIAYGRYTQQATAQIFILVLCNLLHGFLLVIGKMLRGSVSSHNS